MTKMLIMSKKNKEFHQMTQYLLVHADLHESIQDI